MNNEVTEASTTDPSNATFRKSFFGWQCRIRQNSFRQGDGRPTEGMVPGIFLEDGQNITQAVVLLNKSDRDTFIKQFQMTVRKTHDPLERWESAVRLFEGTYFNDPASFSDELTALFGPGSGVSQTLTDAGKCILNFRQSNQVYQFVCHVNLLGKDDPAYQLTYWHNHLFNPAIPSGSQVLKFIPDWSTAKADPDVY